MSIDHPVDSPEGIAVMMKWAAAHHMLLNERHHEIADKHGVSTDGVTFSEFLPNVRMVDHIA